PPGDAAGRSHGALARVRPRQRGDRRRRALRDLPRRRSVLGLSPAPAALARGAARPVRAPRSRRSRAAEPARLPDLSPAGHGLQRLRLPRGDVTRRGLVALLVLALPAVAEAQPRPRPNLRLREPFHPTMAMRRQAPPTPSPPPTTTPTP